MPGQRPKIYGRIVRWGAPLLARDFQGLSAFRMAFGGFLLVDYFVSVRPFLAAFYGATGIVPLSLIMEGPYPAPARAVATALEGLGLPLLLPYAYPAAALAFCIGYRTRLSNAALLIFYSYLYWRNLYIVSGAEDLARLLLIWSLFLPLSRYWSVDAALDSGSRDRRYPALPFVALRLQICSVYFFSGLFKLAGPTWVGGTAVSIAMRDNVFGGTPTGLYLVANWPVLLVVATYGIVVFQLAVPALIYLPSRNDMLRGIAIAGLAVMHLSFAICLNIWQFPYLSIIMLLLLTKDSWWNSLFAERRIRLGRVRIFYDPECLFCHKVSRLLREFLLSPSSQVLPANVNSEALTLLRTHGSWIVRGSEGETYLKWRAMTYVLSQNPIFAPLAWAMDLRTLRRPMEIIYDGIGSNRRLFSWLADRLLPMRCEPRIGVLAQVLCAMLAAAALICNLSTMQAPRFEALFFDAEPAALVATRSIHPVFDYLQVGQRWNLFAPNLNTTQREFVLTGHFSDGTRADLRDVLPSQVLYRDPSVDSQRFVNSRWQSFLYWFEEFDEARWIPFADYLCVNAGTKSSHLTSIEVAVFHFRSGMRLRGEELPAATRVRGCPRGPTT